MIEQEFSEAVRQLAEDVGGVAAEDEVVIVTDPEKIRIARCVASICRSIGATVVTVVKPRLDSHGTELPESVGSALVEADVAFGVNTHAMTHTTARRRASEEGVPFVILRGVTEEIMIEQMDTDYEELREITRAVAAIQTAASEAHVSTSKGTNVRMDLAGRTGVAFDDDISLNGFAGFPTGKSAVSPVEGTTDGTIVVDYSFDNIGTLDEPIELTVEDGTVRSVRGGGEAEQLRRILEDADEGARNIAEAPSIGTNKDVKLVGNQATDKKKRGTVHFAIGDNVSLGGSVHTSIHLDATVLQPTVSFDGETIIDEGDFNEAKVKRLAAEWSDD